MMTLVKWCMLGVFFTFMSCQGNEKDYVSSYEDDKLIGVLIDLYTAEAAIKDIQANLQDSLTQLYRAQIATIHQVDMLLVEKDLKELQSKPERFHSIHKLVQDSIVIMEKSFNKKIEKKITKDKKGTTVKDAKDYKELILPTND